MALGSKSSLSKSALIMKQYLITLLLISRLIVSGQDSIQTHKNPFKHQVEQTAIKVVNCVDENEEVVFLFSLDNNYFLIVSIDSDSVYHEYSFNKKDSLHCFNLIQLKGTKETDIALDSAINILRNDSSIEEGAFLNGKSPYVYGSVTYFSFYSKDRSVKASYYLTSVGFIETFPYSWSHTSLLEDYKNHLLI